MAPARNKVSNTMRFISPVSLLGYRAKLLLSLESGKSFHIICRLVHDELVADAAHVHNPYPFVPVQLMAQFGDEHVQAPLVEEGVVSPQVEEDVAHVHYLVLMLAEPAQDFALAVAQLRLCAVMVEALGAGGEDIIANLEQGLGAGRLSGG